METFLLIYFAMSLIVMQIVQPQNDPKNPVGMCIMCFITGGLIFMAAVLLGLIRALTGKEFFDE